MAGFIDNLGDTFVYGLRAEIDNRNAPQAGPDQLPAGTITVRQGANPEAGVKFAGTGSTILPGVDNRLLIGVGALVGLLAIIWVVRS